jgi:hypothetical protein
MINNNGFWIGFIGTSIAITTNYNSSQSATVQDSLHSLLDYECLLFCRDSLASNLRIGHFFSFRCSPVNTPQLNTQLLNSLTTESLNSRTNSLELNWTELSFSNFEANRKQINISNSSSVTASIRCHGYAFLASRCLAMGYPASIRCSGNVYRPVV